MRAVVVYESMFGNTHLVADAVGAGLREALGAVAQVEVVPVGDADAACLEGADLVVVGGPTHAHGMTRAATRASAAEMAKDDEDLDLDPDAEGPGLRDWFDDVDGGGARAAAFDTRIDAPAALTGRASKGISKRLRRHGFDECVPPMSFLVTKENHLEPGEEDHARTWGKELAEVLAG